MDDGSSCPNQAYASQWSVYNLVTGKPLLDTTFRNYHWGNTPIDSNSNSNANSNACTVLSSRMKQPENVENEIDSPWNHILSNMTSRQTYAELESFILSLDVEYKKVMKCTVQKFKKKKHTSDVIAEKLRHADAPKNHLSVITLADGNCCTHSLSIVGFGDDSKTHSNKGKNCY